MLLAVNFHYIEAEPDHPHPAIFPTPPDRLGAQLEALSQSFEFVSGEQLLGALAGKALPEHACVITFDDGLRSQFENALPVLDRLGVPALFFASPRPVLEGEALGVHKIHYVRARLSPERILEVVEPHATAAALERARETYRYDEPDAALAKWILNFGLAPAVAEERVGSLFRGLVADEAAWCERSYIGRDGLRELAARGWLGNHGWSHRPLATLGAAQMRRDLGRSQSALEAITGRPVPYVSYPYGGSNAVGAREAEAAGALGLRIGFTMERALNRTLEQPLLLARVDTNDAPGGKRPLLEQAASGLHCGSGMAAQRSRYFDEGKAA
jgi:peptidoglycan/xylan/chitin deacetylase (PgdA/CDA1 family)